MSDGVYQECVFVRCAAPGCEREHMVILQEGSMMGIGLLIHCMSCLSTMEFKIVSEDQETGEIEMQRRIKHTREQLRENIESEVNSGCQN